MVKLNARDEQGRIIDASILLRSALNKNVTVRMADEKQPNRPKAKREVVRWQVR